MPNRIGRRGVVIGAGMGGLAAAQAISPYLEQVTVLERDALPDEPAPRTGTPAAAMSKPFSLSRACVSSSSRIDTAERRATTPAATRAGETQSSHRPPGRTCA